MVNDKLKFGMFVFVFVLMSFVVAGFSPIGNMTLPLDVNETEIQIRYSFNLTAWSGWTELNNVRTSIDNVFVNWSGFYNDNGTGLGRFVSLVPEANFTLGTLGNVHIPEMGLSGILAVFQGSLCLVSDFISVSGSNASVIVNKTSILVKKCDITGGFLNLSSDVEDYMIPFDASLSVDGVPYFMDSLLWDFENVSINLTLSNGTHNFVFVGFGQSAVWNFTLFNNLTNTTLKIVKKNNPIISSGSSSSSSGSGGHSGGGAVMNRDKNLSNASRKISVIPADETFFRVNESVVEPVPIIVVDSPVVVEGRYGWKSLWFVMFLLFVSFMIGIGIIVFHKKRID